VVSNGTLKVIAKQEEFGGLGYTSARLRTLGLVDIDLTQSRLRLEARIKVPYGASKGLWPAFWMLPSNFETSQWPLGGEIDIMEFIGREPNNVSNNVHESLYPVTDIVHTTHTACHSRHKDICIMAINGPIDRAKAVPFGYLKK
jgi:beta-glucanase (GH16 family)